MDAKAWLDAYVKGAIDRPEPSAAARALTVAGLRSPNAQSQTVLARDWNGGFLGAVARAARDAYSEGERSVRWLAAWRAAKTPLIIVGAHDGQGASRVDSLAPALEDARIPLAMGASMNASRPVRAVVEQDTAQTALLQAAELDFRTLA